MRAPPDPGPSQTLQWVIRVPALAPRRLPGPGFPWAVLRIGFATRTFTYDAAAQCRRSPTGSKWTCVMSKSPTLPPIGG